MIHNKINLDNQLKLTIKVIISETLATITITQVIC